MQIFIIVKNAVLYILYIYIISKFKLALSGYDEIYLIMMAVLALVLCYIKSNSILVFWGTPGIIKSLNFPCIVSFICFHT
jgi:chromate transport protein ChrA